jgi:hypothetical protein
METMEIMELPGQMANPGLHCLDTYFLFAASPWEFQEKRGRRQKLTCRRFSPSTASTAETAELVEQEATVLMAIKANPDRTEIPGWALRIVTTGQDGAAAAAMRELAALVVMVATAETGPMYLFLSNPAGLIVLRQSTFQSTEGVPGIKGNRVRTGNQVMADPLEEKPTAVQQIDLDRTAARPPIAGILNNTA